MNKWQKHTFYKKNCILKNLHLNSTLSGQFSHFFPCKCKLLCHCLSRGVGRSGKCQELLALRCLSLVERLMGMRRRLGLGLGRGCWVALGADFRLAGRLPEWGSLRSRPGKTLSFRTGSGWRAVGSAAGDRSAREMTLHPASLISCSLFVQISSSLSFQSRLPLGDLASLSGLLRFIRVQFSSQPRPDADSSRRKAR